MAGHEEQARADGSARLRALRETGLSSVADEGMDRFARLVSSVLGVPVALVSLVEEARQVFPGMIGLREPWAGARQTPLTHSLCQYVVADGEPLVVSDARARKQTALSPAIDDLGVVAYAGVPLTDENGHVLGSLCAIDNRPRDWSERELADLDDLAAACSTELRLRIVSDQREQARRGEAEARLTADELRGRTQTALRRSQLLLRAADTLADTTGLEGVRQQVRDLVTSDLEPVYVGLVLAEGGRMRRLVDRMDSTPFESRYETYGLGSAWPTARAARENRTISIHTPEELAAGYGPDAAAAYRELGLYSAVCVPLPGTAVPLGTLVLGWDRPYEIDIVEQALLVSLAGYTARAVERALFVENRVDVAHQMQQAMLTALPEIEGLESSVLYRPAAEADMVGGDWYDLYPRSFAADGAEGGGGSTRRGTGFALTIGDITGHDIHAATLMAQARSMLRQADLDHPGSGPGHVLAAFEHANRTLGLNASGTLVHAHLRRRPPPEDGGWELSWTNAGHPPPLLVLPDGTAGELSEHGPMVHSSFGAPDRDSYHRHLAPGTVLLFYTDGLVERRRADMDVLVERAQEVLSTHRASDLATLVTRIADTVGEKAPRDDVALLVVRIPEAEASDRTGERA